MRTHRHKNPATNPSSNAREMTGAATDAGRPGTAHRGFGIFIILISALFFSTAGVFSKGVASDAWVIITWRALFAAVLGVGWLVLHGSLRREIRHFGGSALAVAIVYACGTSAFIPAFKLTSVANVALIWGTAPLVAALVAWLWLRETMSARFFMACAVVIAGVGVLVMDSLGGTHLLGDGLALVMTLMMAVMMTLYRRWPGTPVVLPTVLGGLFLVPVGFTVTRPLDAPAFDIMLCAGFALTFLVASVTLAIGSRLLAPGETALLSLTETPYAIILAMVFLGAVPDLPTVVGGVMIMGAVGWYQLSALR